jgi:hypothetical protein
MHIFHKARQRTGIMLRCMFRWKALVISFQKYINQFIKTKSKKRPFLHISFASKQRKSIIVKNFTAKSYE